MTSFAVRSDVGVKEDGKSRLLQARMQMMREELEEMMSEGCTGGGLQTTCRFLQTMGRTFLLSVVGALRGFAQRRDVIRCVL